MKCECCLTREAVTKDYREMYGQLNKFYVCELCLWRSDHSFICKMRATAKPKKIKRRSNRYKRAR
jgi:hypothetical protein